MNEHVTLPIRKACSLAELAASLGVSIGFVRLEVTRKHLHVIRLGRRVLVTCAEADRYLSQRSQVSSSSNPR
jgi:hypothetical protein